MADSPASGVKLAEQHRTEHAIERVPTGVVAFVGRTLKGPVNQVLAVRSFVEFQQHFGGLWQPSTLSYAIEQFFENGGREARIVRVVNGARPPTLSLPAGASVLRLTAINPGSREYLRASVDYDGLSPTENEYFNLVVQRVRTAGSELVEDQEIYRRVSITPSAVRCVREVLLESGLVRTTGPLPTLRPDRTAGGPGGVAVGYTLSNPDGDDGAPLTDYDVIGSAARNSGLFALQGAHGFNMLCIPPLTRERDVGLSTLLVAARLCRERHALLVVDPPAAWGTARAALDALRLWPFRSDSAVMYFPRVQAFDRLRGRVEVFSSCGAAAGMIARSDETWPVWAAAESEEAILRPGLRPAVVVDEADRARLAQAGVNTFLSVRSGARSGVSPRTLVRQWRLRLALPLGAPPGAVRRGQHRAGHPLGAAGAQRPGRSGSVRRPRWRASSTAWPSRALSPALPPMRRISSSPTSASTAPRASPRASSTCCLALPPASPVSSTPGW